MQPNTLKTMSFFEHFDELRLRLMRCLVAFFLGFILCYLVSEPILAFLRRPLFEFLPESQQKLYFTHLFENFLTHLKISGYASLFLFSPFYFYQVWGFVEPGLYPKERKWVFPFVTAATTFFIGGASFAYYVLFPVGFKYFIQYGSESDVPMLTIDAYYSTCLKLMLLFGLAFELPVLICLFGMLGVIDAEFLRTHRRNAILGITVLSALFAPPDAISMLLLGVPLVLLYECSIWFVHWFRLKRTQKPKEEAEEVVNPLEGRSR